MYSDRLVSRCFSQDCPAALTPFPLAPCSFYPLYPPATGAFLDSSLASALQMPCTPDILLLPSDLSVFAKPLQLPTAEQLQRAAGVQEGEEVPPAAQAALGGTVLCINPGRLAKGTTGGTLAQLQIKPSQEGLAALRGEQPPTNGAISHRVSERCRVTIQRV